MHIVLCICIEHFTIYDFNMTLYIRLSLPVPKYSSVTDACQEEKTNEITRMPEVMYLNFPLGKEGICRHFFSGYTRSLNIELTVIDQGIA